MPLGKTPILQNDLMAEGDNQKYLLFNDALVNIEDADNRALTIDMSTDNVALTEMQTLRYAVVKCTGHTVARTLTIPISVGSPPVDTNRKLAVRNDGTGPITVTHNNAGIELVVPVGETALIYADGTDIISLGGVANSATIPLLEEGTQVIAALLSLNLAGTGFTITDDGNGAATVTFSMPVDFTDLGDVPANYTGHGSKVLAVKADETGVEFITNPGMSDAAVKTAYENNADTNAFTDAEKTKLTGIETGATADMTGAEIKAAYEGEANTNAFTDAEKSKLAGLEDAKFKGTYTSASALDTAHPTSEVGSYAYVDAGIGQDVQMYIWDDDDSNWVVSSSGGGGSDTPADIKTKYESNADTNAFTDAEKTKLTGIETGATADMTGAEIVSAIDTELGGTDWQTGGSGGGGGGPISAAHWRISSMEVASTTGRAIAEIEFRETAVGAATAPLSVSASSNWPGYPAADAVDSDTATFWTSNGLNAGEWFAAEFASPINIEEIVITARNDSNFNQSPQRFNLEYSSDGVEWHTAGVTQETPTAYTTGSSQTFDVSGITTSSGGGGVAVSDDGTEVTAAASRLNFTGDGVTVTDQGAGAVDIAITGGGGGGTTTNYKYVTSSYLLQDYNAVMSTSSYAAKGVIVTPLTDRIVSNVDTVLAAGQTVKLVIAELADVDPGTISSVVFDGTPLVTSAEELYSVDAGDTRLTAGTIYAVMFVRTDGTDTTALSLPYPSGAGYSDPYNNFAFNGAIRYASADPTVGDATYYANNTAVGLSIASLSAEAVDALSGSNIITGGDIKIESESTLASNGRFESGDATGWTVNTTSGTLQVYVNPAAGPDGIPAHPDGHNFIAPTGTPITDWYIEQDIDVPAGTHSVYVSYDMADAFADDGTQVIMTFLDVNDNAIGTAITGPIQSNSVQDTWDTFFGPTEVVPDTARKVRVRLYVPRQGGSNDIVALTDITLHSVVTRLDNLTSVATRPGNIAKLPFAAYDKVGNASSWAAEGARNAGTPGVSVTADDDDGYFKLSLTGPVDVTRFENPDFRPTAGTDFDHVVRVNLNGNNDSFSVTGLYVGNSANSKVLSVGLFWNQQFYRQYWTGDTFDSENTVYDYGVADFDGYVRLKRTSDSFVFSISNDGIHWRDIHTETVSSILGDIDRVGVLVNGTGTAATMVTSATVLGWNSGGPQPRAEVGNFASATYMQQPAKALAHHTVTNGDLGGNVVRRMGNSGAATVTVPAGLTNKQPMTILATGPGQVSIAAGTGVTIHSADGFLNLRTQYSSASLVPDMDADDVYYLLGDLA